jgi:hypothetical protein
MQCPSLPFWIQLLQALGTPAIAALAIVIGVMQWRTAHQRAVLDLFDKRFDTYQELRTIVGSVLGHGNVRIDTAKDFSRATDKAQFLFGPEVSAYLATVYELLTAHGKAEDMMKLEGPDHEKWVTKKWDAFNEIAQFYDRILPLIQRYMRMHQKAPLF